MGAQLGSGNFAVVKKAIRKADNAEVAIKIIDKAKVEDMNDITVSCPTSAALGAPAQAPASLRAWHAPGGLGRVPRRCPRRRSLRADRGTCSPPPSPPANVAAARERART